jgi:hypothetical protein
LTQQMLARWDAYADHSFSTFEFQCEESIGKQRS